MPEPSDVRVTSSPPNERPRSLLDSLYQIVGLAPPEEAVHPVVRCLNIVLHLVILMITQLWVGLMMVVSKCGFGAEPQDAANLEPQDAGPSEVLDAEGHTKSKRDVNLEADAKAVVQAKPFPKKDSLIMLSEAPAFGVSETHGDTVGRQRDVTDIHNGVMEQPANTHMEDLPQEEEILNPTVKPRISNVNSIPYPELEEVQVMVGDIIQAEEEIAADPKFEQNELGKEMQNANNKTSEEHR